MPKAARRLLIEGRPRPRGRHHRQGLKKPTGPPPACRRPRPFWPLAPDPPFLRHLQQRACHCRPRAAWRGGCAIRHESAAAAPGRLLLEAPPPLLTFCGRAADLITCPQAAPTSHSCGTAPADALDPSPSCLVLRLALLPACLPVLPVRRCTAARAQPLLPFTPPPQKYSERLPRLAAPSSTPHLASHPSPLRAPLPRAIHQSVHAQHASPCCCDPPTPPSSQQGPPTHAPLGDSMGGRRCALASSLPSNPPSTPSSFMPHPELQS